MFDDIKINDGDGQESKKPESAESGDKTPESAVRSDISPTHTGVEDMFSGVEDSAVPEKPAVLQPRKQKGGKFPVAGTGQDLAESGQAGQKKKLLGLIILLIGLIILGYGGYWGYAAYIKSGSDSEGLIPGETDNQGEILPENQETEDTKESGSVPGSGYEEGEAEPEPVPPPVDTDQDGLSDDEERSLGTSWDNIDTDEDGLFDREEVRVYRTDPLDPDSDDDGFPDGSEVEAGYNPLGPGKLYGDE